MTAEEARKISQNNSREDLVNKIVEKAFVEIEKNAKMGLYQVCLTYKNENQEDLTNVCRRLTELGYRCHFTRKDLNSNEITIKWNW